MPSSVDVSFAKKVIEEKLVKKGVVLQCLNAVKKSEASGRPVTLVQLMLHNKILTPNQVRTLGYDVPAQYQEFHDADSTDEIPVAGSDFAIQASRGEEAEQAPAPEEVGETKAPWDEQSFELEGDSGGALNLSLEESGEEPPPLIPAEAGQEEEPEVELVPESEEEEGEPSFLPELTLEATSDDEEFFGEEAEPASEEDFHLELSGEEPEEAEPVDELNETTAAQPPRQAPDVVPELTGEEEELEAEPELEPEAEEADEQYLPPLDILGEIEKGEEPQDVSSSTDEIPAVGSVNARETAMFPTLQQPSAEDAEAIPLPPEQGTDIAAEPEEFKGEPFRNYLLGPVLHNGAFGKVHRAMDTQTQEKLLLEVATREELRWLGSDVEQRLAVCGAASALNHRNIAKVPDGGWEGDRFFLTHAVAGGSRLPEYMHDRVVLPVKEACSFMFQCCSALSAAEKKDILHRDIRPVNMWVLENGTIKILNFGFPLEPLLTGPYSSAAPMTLNRASFLAPEICGGQPMTVQAGIYALGVSFYYILTGRYPVMGETYLSTGYRHLNPEIVNPKRYVSEIPDELVNIVLRMLALRPQERFQSFRQVIDDLEPFDVGRPVTFATSPPPSNMIQDSIDVGEPVFCIVRGRNRGVSFKVADGEEVSIGRDSSQSTLPVLDGMVSRKHCAIENRDGKFFCRDTGSSNGTFVNRHRISEPVKLRSGDRVRIGSTEILFGRIPNSPDAFHFAQTACDLQLVSMAQAEECLLELGDRESRGKQLSVSRVMHLKGYIEVDQLGRAVATMDQRLYAYDLQQRRLREQQASLLMSHPDRVVLPEGSYMMRSLLEEFLFCEGCGCLIYNEQISTAEAERCGDSVFCPACAVHSTFLGERIDDLLLLHLIAQGRLGSVYQAARGQEQVAVKMIHHNFMDVPGIVDVLRAKVEQMRDVSHPNVARMLDVIRSGNTYAILMELAGRISLDDLLMPGIGESPKSMRPWEAPRALEVVHDIGCATAYLHSNGIVHGELTPAKIMFGPDGVLRLVSTGIGAMLVVPPDMLQPPSSNLPPDAFMGPEVLRGAPPDEASDQFSVGAIAWTLLMGKRFDARTAEHELMAEKSPVPSDIAEVVGRMIQLKPADRYASMGEAQDALESLKGHA